MPPLTPSEITFLVAVLMVLATMLYLAPSCSEAACTNAHRHHAIQSRAASIERTHLAFHDRLHPNATCSLCQARKRDDT